MVVAHFLPGIDGICNNEIAIETHSLTALVAILRVDLEEPIRVGYLEKLHDMNFGCFWCTGYGAEDQDAVLTR
jgi:hypothetical protein